MQIALLVSRLPVEEKEERFFAHLIHHNRGQRLSVAVSALREGYAAGGRLAMVRPVGKIEAEVLLEVSLPVQFTDHC